MRLVFVTPNSWNADESQRLLAGLDVEFSRLALPRPEGASLEDVARSRVEAAWRALGRPCFVENAELALEGEPPFSGARFKKLLRELGDEGFCRRFANRPGVSRVVVALKTSADDVQLFTGRAEGLIVPAPRGAGGYGWDRLWQPDGYTRTLAEFGTSSFLVNMRQRPYLELAAHVRGDGTPGYFEAHLTVKPCDMAAFAATCARLEVKCLHIVMPETTAQHEQPMTGSYHLGTLSQAREQVLELARALVRDGFEVTRMKLEATGRAFGAPDTDADGASLPNDVYFEHHATVVLPDGLDDATLLSAVRAHGGYVSRNLRKSGNERFVTVRSYQVGRNTADARFELVIEALRTLNVPIKNRAREFAVFDSAPAIDAGWMG